MRFVNQSVAVLGLGLETLDFLRWLDGLKTTCSVTVFDRQTEVELAPLIKQLPADLAVKTFFGPDYLAAGLNEFQIIVRSPGFYRLHPVLLAAQKHRVKITSPTKLFFEFCPAKIIGVTGTKGKGTTASLIAAILRASGINVFLAGNIGKPMLKLLSVLKPKDWVCLELSSFQLQDLTVSPHISVVLNITSEHLDVHRHTREYRLAKTNLVRWQSKADFAVLNSDYQFSRSLAHSTKAQIYWFSRYQRVTGSYVYQRRLYLKTMGQPLLVGSVDKLLLRGEHNWENVTAAIVAGRLARASIVGIKKAVFEFKGLEHRLELVKEVNQVKFYNDSFSTIPETAIAALQSFHEPIVIILGGSDKGSDYSHLGATLHSCHRLAGVILIGQMAGKIKASIAAAGRLQAPVIEGLTDMKSIVSAAVKLAPPVSAVVLSPACASFDMFINYKDRGDQFKYAVNQLQTQN
ncbi:MAG: UDP-N-acetylmuramoyl-L-alanine--D-glutamate ligase [Patescibacteria group bacterium]